jgi:hypothetical protein
MLREWAVDRQGLYVADLPVNSAWGTGDRDSTAFSLVRMNVPDGLVNDFRLRNKRLENIRCQIDGNLYGEADVVDSAESDRLIVGFRYLNLRTGQTSLSPEDALADAQELDLVFQHKASVVTDDSIGYLVRLNCLAPPRFGAIGPMTFKEALKCS